MSDTPFNKAAADLIKTSMELIEQVLLKHSNAVLEEMHDQIVKRNTRISDLERELAAAQAELQAETLQRRAAQAKLAKYEQAKMPEFDGLDAMRECCSRCDKQIAYIDELRTFAAAQTVRADENERDARRYRWLRGRYSAADADYRDFGLREQRGRSVAIFSVPDPWPFSFDYERAAELMDAAIDTAIKEQT